MKSFWYPLLFILLASSLISIGYAASPVVTIKSGHFPTYEGIVTVWYTNTDSVNVSLNFSGPWDFTTGPKQKKFTQKLIVPSGAFDFSKFPAAKFAIEITANGKKQYEFRTKTATGVVWYGMSSPPDNPDESNFILTPAPRLVFFPAKVGKAFTQTGTIQQSGGAAPVTLKSKIVGKGIVVLGAGTFNDSVMIQHKVQIGSTQSYILYEWYVPYLGKVASIQSRIGETNELFTSADEYKWMLSCKMP